MLKSPAIELRKTGAAADADPSFELCIVVDCCGRWHMEEYVLRAWLERLKSNISGIIDKVVQECQKDGTLKCRVSFVAYRDFDRTGIENTPAYLDHPLAATVN